MTGDTTEAFDDLRLSGDEEHLSAGPDHVYTFEKGSNGSINARLTGFKHATLYLRSVHCDSEHTYKYKTDTKGEGIVTIENNWPGAGTYWLIVDGELETDAGEYELLFDIVDDNSKSHPCEYPFNLGAITLSEGTPTSMTLNDSLSWSDRDNHVIDCRNTGTTATSGIGEDRVYRFSLNERARMKARLQDAFEDAEPILYLKKLDECDSPNHLDCRENGTPVIERILDPGIYVLIVDSSHWVGINGEYTLDLTFTKKPDPLGESCEDPIPLELDVVAQHNSTHNAYNDSNLSYGGYEMTGADHVYEFVVDEQRELKFEIDGFEGLAAYIRKDLGNPLDCDNNLYKGPYFERTGGFSPDIEFIEEFEPGTYYLFIDGKTGSHRGTYSVKVTRYSDMPSLDCSFQGAVCSFVCLTGHLPQFDHTCPGSKKCCISDGTW